MSVTLARSPGLSGALVGLGSRQDAMLGVMRRATRRHPSRTWAKLPPLRTFDCAASTAHRAVHALARLGLVALQATLGREGEIRFTFGVRPWSGPLASTRRTLARMRGPLPASPGQLTLALPATVPRPGPEPAGGPTFGERMAAAGLAAWWRA